MNFLLKQQMRHERLPRHHAHHSQMERLDLTLLEGKASGAASSAAPQEAPPRWSYQCTAFLRLFALEIRVQLHFLISTF